ncbi:MAG: mannose-1-phosphate guanylyltransferase [Pirellulales bacterium]
MLHAIIMAGGTGTRFWPASRIDAPKQLLSLVDDGTMIRQTVDRLSNLVTPERTLVVTNQRLTHPIAKQLPELPASSILGEPCKRDTAPCIGLAALLVSRDDVDATLVVMPADHVIRNADQFQASVRHGTRLVNDNSQKNSTSGRIVTFGIRPSYAAEIFGYIQRGSPLEIAGDQSSESTISSTPDRSNFPTYQVKQFREKPNTATATDYLASGDYYWNSGIFIWKAQTILEALAKWQPQMLSHLRAIVDAWDTDRQQSVLEREFSAIDAISIDYAVMEHATDVVVIEAPFDWDDLGGWQSLARLLGSDSQGNTLVGKQLTMNCSNTIVRSTEDHLVVSLGMSDCIIVHTPDATLVANRHDEESIRAVVKELQSRGWNEYL